MVMDLPKGIVVNSPGISSDVDRINTEPVASEIFAQFWKGDYHNYFLLCSSDPNDSLYNYPEDSS